MAGWSKNQWAEQWKVQRLAQEAEQGMPSQTFAQRVIAERGGVADPNMDVSGFVGGAIKSVGKSSGIFKDIIAYHGSTGTNPYERIGGGIKEFRMGGEGGAFFSSDPAIASSYAEKAAFSPTVYPVRLRFKNPLIRDELIDPQISQAEIIDMAKRLGHDSIIRKNVLDNPIGSSTGIRSDVYIALHPQQIRHMFGVFGERH